jgi:hypothetical protein
LGEKHCFARKNELVYHKIYETRQQAIADVTRYIEIFYNRQRIQKGLGFKSPAGVSKTFTVRLPDEIYQVFYSVFDSKGHLFRWLVYQIFPSVFFSIHHPYRGI